MISNKNYKNITNKKDLNSYNSERLSKEVDKMKKEADSKEIKKAFDRLQGCIEYDGSGVELLKSIRRNIIKNLKVV